MNISLNWLKEFISIDHSPAELAEILTNLGLAVDGFSTYESIPGSLAGVVVGKIIECVKHPNADRPYKAFGYPVLPAIYILMAVSFCTLLIIYKPEFVKWGLGITLAGIPLYYFAVANRSKKA